MPLTPSGETKGTPDASRVLTTGTPAAIASSCTMPNASLEPFRRDAERDDSAAFAKFLEDGRCFYVVGRGRDDCARATQEAFEEGAEGAARQTLSHDVAVVCDDGSAAVAAREVCEYGG